MYEEKKVDFFLLTLNSQSFTPTREKANKYFILINVYWELLSPPKYQHAKLNSL